VNRWIGFGLVWLALATLTVDSLRTAHTLRRDAAAAPTLTPETAIS
jgi:chloramphenicol-sensitive protein RarD